MHPGQDNVQLRCEADLYGYSRWLAGHLGYPFAPLSLRGFQHGWIWWDETDAPYEKGYGLDPNLHDYWGMLVQNERVAGSLRARGIYAHACGLPFVHFYRHCGLAGSFAGLRTGRTLYVPTHSNPWNDLSGDVAAAAARFTELQDDCAVMLSWGDRRLAPTMASRFSAVEIGAGALEQDSFYRLLKIFESYDTMITDSMGSHVCYALVCGMKVGIHAGLYRKVYDGESARRTIDSQRAQDSGHAERYDRIMSLEYLDRRFPGIVIDGGPPTYSTPPAIANERPDVVARLLGWEATFDSERVKAEAAVR